MAFDLQLLSNFSSFAAMAFLLVSVYYLKDAVRLVSQSIHNSVRWDFLNLSLVLILLNVLFSIYTISAGGPSYYDAAFFLWRNVFLILACLMLLTVTFQAKEATASNRIPMQAKAAAALTVIAGLFLSLHSHDQTYALHHALITFSYAFLGLTTACITVYARQFDKISRVSFTLTRLTYFIFAAGIARIFLYSSYSPIANPTYSNAGLNLAVYSFLALLGLFAAFTLKDFRDTIARFNLKAAPARDRAPITQAKKREIINRINRRDGED